MIKSISKYMMIGLTDYGEKCFESELCKRIRGEKLGDVNTLQGFHSSFDRKDLLFDIKNSGLKKEVIQNLILNYRNICGEEI